MTFDPRPHPFCTFKTVEHFWFFFYVKINLFLNVVWCECSISSLSKQLIFCSQQPQFIVALSVVINFPHKEYTPILFKMYPCCGYKDTFTRASAGVSGILHVWHRKKLYKETTLLGIHIRRGPPPPFFFFVQDHCPRPISGDAGWSFSELIKFVYRLFVGAPGWAGWLS